MNLKTYHGSTIAEALSAVKRDLGRDAVILQTRTIRRGGLFGLGGREVVEITASDEVNVVSRGRGASEAAAPLAQRRNELLARLYETRNSDSAKRETASSAAAGNGANGQGETPVGDNALQLKSELSAIRDMVADLVRQNRSARMPELPEELFQAYVQLLESEVADELARQIVGSLRNELTGQESADRRRVREALVDCISRMIPTAEPATLSPSDRARVIALVGPTGVGKTTTIAKLAANYKLREGRRVGLVTIDTYRIAAVNQLATYAQIIDVPLKVVLTPEELKRTIEELASACDIILLDTAGRSPNDTLKLNELRGFLSAVRPDETHLVLSSTSTASAVKSAVQRFAPVGINRIILTKLDEAVSFGIILQIVRQVDASLSYVTTGQDVPDDIEVGSARRLARWIVNRSLSEEELAASETAGSSPRADNNESNTPQSVGVDAHA